MKSLSEMFTKKFVPENNKQSSILEIVEKTSESKEHKNRIASAVVNSTSVELVEYKHEDMKRRAMTISSAADIAANLFASIAFTGTHETYLSGSVFRLKEKEMLAAQDVAEELSFGSVKLCYTNQLNILNNISNDLESGDIDINTDDIIYALSAIAVQLAWLDAYVSSGFFPSDISVMETYSKTNTKLVEEVRRLLEVFSSFCSTLENPKFVFNPFTDDSELGLEGSRGMIIDDNFFEIKTTGSIDKNIKKDSKTNLAYFIALKDKYSINSSVLYYIRYDLTLKNFE